MSDVSFNEEPEVTRRYASSSQKQGGIAGLVIRMGLAKNESQANVVMISIAVVAIVIMIFIWMPHGSKPKPTAVPVTNPVQQAP